MIDNDMAFGEYRFNEADRRNSQSKLGRPEEITMMDAGLVTRLNAIDRAQLDLHFGDVLTTTEIDALELRVNLLKAQSLTARHMGQDDWTPETADQLERTDSYYQKMMIQGDGFRRDKGMFTRETVISKDAVAEAARLEAIRVAEEAAEEKSREDYASYMQDRADEDSAVGGDEDGVVEVEEEPASKTVEEPTVEVVSLELPATETAEEVTVEVVEESDGLEDYLTEAEKAARTEAPKMPSTPPPARSASSFGALMEEEAEERSAANPEKAARANAWVKATPTSWGPQKKEMEEPQAGKGR